MAERRMFAKTIVLSDAFLDMPLGARCLYMTLSMVADDVGFVNSPKSIMRQCGASVDDMNILLMKKFILAFDDGIVVIKHWRINNYLRSDRYTETKYIEQKSMLELDENGAWRMAEKPHGIPVVDQPVYPGKDSIGKDSIGYIESKPKRFTKPTLDEVAEYCSQRRNGIDAQHFIDYYESRGWMIGKNHMKDWKACVRTWEQRNKPSQKEEDVLPTYDSSSNDDVDLNRIDEILKRREKC